MILEIPFAQWTKAVYDDVERIIRWQHITVILAHVECFYRFQKNKDIWNRIFELPVIARFNTECLLSITKRRLAIQSL